MSTERRATTAEAARIVGMTPSLLVRARERGAFPKRGWSRGGHVVRPDPDDADGWLIQEPGR